MLLKSLVTSGRSEATRTSLIFSLISLLAAFLTIALCSTAIAVPNSASPSASPTPTTSPTASASNVPGLSPDYRDPEIPQIQNLNTSSSKDGNIFSLIVQLDVKIHRNTLSSIELNFLPKTLGINQNPKLLPPCVKLGSIKANTSKPGESMPTLQSRSANGDWFVESHVITYKVNLPPVLYSTTTPTYQDICDGQYLISTIILKDAANHLLTITANAASTAPVVANQATTSPQSSSPSKSKYTDSAIMQADFWADTFAMPCAPGNNLAPTTTNQVVKGKTVPVTSNPTMPLTVRTTCNQTLDFNKAYLTVSGSGSGTTSATGTSSLPIVDYATQIQTLTAENEKLKASIAELNKQLKSKKPTPTKTPSKTVNKNKLPAKSTPRMQGNNSNTPNTPRVSPSPNSSRNGWRNRSKNGGWKYTPNPSWSGRSRASTSPSPFK